MTSLTVLARFVAKEDKIEEAKALLISLLAPTRAEEGCINYDLHQDNEHPAHFFLYENWESKAALDVHLKTPHLKTLFEVEKTLFAEPVDLSLASQLS